LGGKHQFRTESQILESTTKFETKSAFIYEARHVAELEQERVTIRLAIKPPRDERKTPLYNDERQLIGEFSLPLWVLAAGPVDHNVPLTNGAGEQVARLRIAIGFEQRATVAVVFGSIECRDLVPQKRGYANPLLEISYSKYTFTDPKKAVQASKQKHNLTPAWNHLPPVRFEATYKEMITEWIDVNVLHHSKFDGFTSIGRCKLILKAILNDDALVRFDGPITRGGNETGKIKGVATFKFLPIFSQMVGGLQTEFGIYGGKQLLPEFLRPKFADALGLMKRVAEKESEFLKVVPPTTRKADGTPATADDVLETQPLEEQAEPPRQRRGRAATEMPKFASPAQPPKPTATAASTAASTAAATTAQPKPATPVKAAVAASPLSRNSAGAEAAASPPAAAAAKKEKRGRAATEMPAPMVAAAPSPKTADDFARDLFSVFTPTLAPSNAPATPTAAAGASPFLRDPFADAAPIVVQPSGLSQTFVAFGDNPFAAFTPSTPPPPAVAGVSPFDLASPSVSRKGSEAPPVALDNPFLAALANSAPQPALTAVQKSTAPASPSPLKAAFNPFAAEVASANPAVEKLKAESNAKRRSRSSTDTSGLAGNNLVDLGF
jgi:hypothetical protein